MKTAAPYRRPGHESVRPGPWTLRIGNEQRPLPDALDTWDYQMGLHLERRVELDVGSICNESGFEAPPELALGVLWTASASALRGAPVRVAIHAQAGIREIALTADLDGRLLGGTLEIETTLFLARALDRPSGPTAWRAGSVLWSDAARCRLQGDAPLFPIAVVDFPPLGYDPRAPWYLHVGADLDAPVSNSVQLLVNARAVEVVKAVENAADPSEHDAAILSAMYYDTGRILLESALSREDFEAGRDFDDETLGDVFAGLLAQLFPGYDLTALRRLRDQDAPRWASEAAAALALFPNKQLRGRPAGVVR